MFSMISSPDPLFFAFSPQSVPYLQQEGDSCFSLEAEELTVRTRPAIKSIAVTMIVSVLRFMVVVLRFDETIAGYVTANLKIIFRRFYLRFMNSRFSLSGCGKQWMKCAYGLLTRDGQIPIQPVRHLAIFAGNKSDERKTGTTDRFRTGRN